MDRISNPGNPDRIELPSSPAVYLRGIVYATRPDAPSSITTTIFSEEKFTPNGDNLLSPLQDS